MLYSFIEFGKNANSIYVSTVIRTMRKICVATIGVCVFRALTSVGALIYFAEVLMKKKICITVLSVVLLFTCGLGLIACTHIGDDTDDPHTPIKTIAANSLVFGYNVEKSKIDDYFVNNGQKTNPLKEEYCITNNLATIFYYPQESKFSIMRQIISQSTLSNAAYTYKWTAAVDINLYDLFSNAVWAGKYEHAALNLNTLNVAAEYTAVFKFGITKFSKVNELADFSSNTYNAQITNATNYSSANRMFEPKIEGEKIYSQFQFCFEAVETIFQQLNKDAVLSSEYSAENYKAIDFSKTTLGNISHNFDNEKHSIYAQNIPDNVLVEYNGNAQIDVGIHTVTAIFKDPKGNVLHSINAEIEITDMFNVTVEYIYGNIVSVGGNGGGEKGFVVGTQKFKAKYNSNILDFCDFPDGFVWKDTSDKWQSFLRDDYTWKGYGDQTFAVSVVPQYEGYVQVFSDTNAAVDNAIISYSALRTTYEDSIKSTNLYGSENLVAFKPSEIKAIKFFNTATIGGIDGTYYTNLEMVDLSDCTHLKSIGSGFFSDCKSLSSVIAPALPNLKIIDDYFLANTNIINFNFDMTAVEEIGSNFLYNSLYGEEERAINIDLKSITSIKLTNFLGSRNYTNSPIINLYIYDYVISSSWFNKNARCNIYVSSQLDYFNKIFEEYPNIQIHQIKND